MASPPDDMEDSHYSPVGKEDVNAISKNPKQFHKKGTACAIPLSKNLSPEKMQNAKRIRRLPPIKSTLAELVGPPRLRPAILLALDRAAVAGQEPGQFQDTAQLRIV